MSTIRGVMDIDVKDEKFKAFLDLYNKYQAQLKEMGGFWKEAGDSAKTAETASGSMVDALAAGATSTALIIDALEKSRHTSVRVDHTMQSMAGHAKSIAGSILSATVELTKWAALSLGAGLIGGGAGLWGLETFAHTVGSERKSAMGLGVSIGEQQAFNVNYGTRLVDPGFLGTVRDAMSDQSKQWMFSAAGLGGELGTADASTMSVDMIRRAHELWQQTGPGGHTKQVMDSLGLGMLGDVETWRRIGNTSSSDLDSYAAQDASDKKSMGVSDPNAIALQNFWVQMDRVGKELEAVFANALNAKFMDSLTRLSAAIEKALAGFLGNPHMTQWIDDAAKAFSTFGTYLGTDKFQSDVKSVVDSIAYAAEALVGAMRFLHILPQAPMTADEQKTATEKKKLESLPSIYNFATQKAWTTQGGEYDFTALEKAEGLPRGTLSALAAQESSTNAHPKDAWAQGVPHQGMFQMSPDMQKETGVTNPYNAQQEAAATSIKMAEYLKKFHGNRAEAFAAWFEGPGAVDSQIADANKQGGNWLKYAGPKTKQYVSDMAGRLNLTVTVMNQTGAQVAVSANSVSPYQ